MQQGIEALIPRCWQKKEPEPHNPLYPRPGKKIDWAYTQRLNSRELFPLKEGQKVRLSLQEDGDLKRLEKSTDKQEREVRSIHAADCWRSIKQREQTESFHTHAPCLIVFLHFLYFISLCFVFLLSTEIVGCYETPCLLSAMLVIVNGCTCALCAV